MFWFCGFDTFVVLRVLGLRVCGYAIGLSLLVVRWLRFFGLFWLWGVCLPYCAFLLIVLFLNLFVLCCIYFNWWLDLWGVFRRRWFWV